MNVELKNVNFNECLNNSINENINNVTTNATQNSNSNIGSIQNIKLGDINISNSKTSK